MPKYTWRLTFENGDTIYGNETGEIFDNESDAYDAGVYASGCCRLGDEVLNMSNPGDYPLSDEPEEVEVDVIELDDRVHRGKDY